MIVSQDTENPPRSGIVTGASRGIGLAVARRLREAGVNLTVTAHDPQRLAQAALGPSDPSCVQTLAGDITDQAFVERLFNAHDRRFGGIDLLVHCAGVAPYGSVRAFPVEDFRRCLEVNLVASFCCVQHAVKRMHPRGGGKIVLLGSVRSHWALFGDCGAYPASKFGLRGMVEAIARQLQREGSNIAISTVSPGKTDTDMGNPKGDDDAMPPDVVADAVLHALNAPPNVNVYETLVFPTTMHPW